MILRWLKFNLVGWMGVLIQLAVLTVLSAWLDVHYLLATMLAVEAALVHNFLWHQRWTWADRPRTSRSGTWFRLAKFNATNGAISLLGNLVLMHVFVGGLGFPVLGANLLAIGICSLVNFLASDRLVFVGFAVSREAGKS